MQHSPTQSDPDGGTPIPTIPGNPFAPFEEVEHHEVAAVSPFLGALVAQLSRGRMTPDYNMYDLMQGNPNAVAVAVTTQQKVGLFMDLGAPDAGRNTPYAIGVALRNFLPCIRPFYNGEMYRVLLEMTDINLYFGLGVSTPDVRVKTVAGYVADCFTKMYGVRQLQRFDLLTFRDKPFPKARAYLKPKCIETENGDYPFARIQVKSMRNWLFLDDFVNSLAIPPIQKPKGRAPIQHFDDNGRPVPRTKKGRAAQARIDEIKKQSIPLPEIPKK